MSYLNQVIRRQAPLTRCQAAVYAVLNEEFASIDEIRKRRPVFVENKAGKVGPVAYGTIGQVLKSLVQQGFAETTGGKRPKYRGTTR